MTLTEASFWTRRFGVIAGSGLVIFVIVVLAVTVQPKQNMPPQYLQANFACTETREEFLPNQLNIPSLSLASGSEAIFDIQTDSGKIDSLPQIINVYKFDNPQQSLSAQAEAKVLAKRMGFDPDTIIRKGTEQYIWVDKVFDRTLEVQTKNLNFKLQTNSSYIRDVSETGSLPSEQEAKSMAVNYLRGLNLLEEDYAAGTHTTSLVSINPDGTFSEVSSMDQAELIKVDIQRSKSMITIPTNIVGAEEMVNMLKTKLPEPTKVSTLINDERIDVYTFNTPVTFEDPNKANISVYIGVEDKEKRTDGGNANVYNVEYTNWPIEPESCGTYELISPAIAIEKIQSGQGSLVYLNELGGDDLQNYIPKKVKKLTILYVNITYLETTDEQEFLQPVYVISGEAILDNDVKANFDYYYPAINYDIVQDKIVLDIPVVEKKNAFGF
jgi:hypothetical protein